MPDQYFEIYNISEGYDFEYVEQLGTKAKKWVIDAENKRFLFKVGRSNTGENWAEVLASSLSSLLNLPHANYFLATDNGEQGVLTNTFVPDDGRLVHGNELLFDTKAIDGEEARSSYRLRQHTVNSIRGVTRLLPNKPLGWGSLLSQIIFS